MQNATLRNLGGSVAVTLPRKLLASIGLDTGSKVNIEIDNGRLVLSPATKKYSLTEMVAGLKVGDLPSDSDFENMPIAGREVLWSRPNVAILSTLALTPH